MHFVYVTPEFVTEGAGGGLATYLSNIARIMTDRGHEVTIVTLSWKNSDRILWNNSVAVERVKRDDRCAVMPFRLMKHSYDLHRRLKDVLKKSRADLIQYASYDAAGFFHVRNVPAVVRISSDPVCWREYRFYDCTERDLEKVHFIDWIEYHAERSIGKIFGPGAATAAVIEKRTGIRPVIIESPFYARNEEDDAVYKEKLDGKKYYLAHSSMSCMKGTHTIAEAIHDVCAEDPDAWFVFAGADFGIDYKDGRHIQAADYILGHAGEYRDRVIFLGNMERRFLMSVIRNAAACLMPSRIDNMPNTCIEAMSMGKIVIGTKGAGFEQLITDGENGFLVPVDDPAALAGAIMRINDLSGIEKKEIEALAVKTTERFTENAIYSHLISYYECIIDRR